MAQQIAIQPVSDFDIDEFFELLHSAPLTDCQYQLEELRQKLDSLSDVDRSRYINFFLGKIIEFGSTFSENYVRQHDGSINPPRRSNLENCVCYRNNSASGTLFQPQFLEASDATPPGHDGAAYPNNGVAGNPFSCNTDVEISTWFTILLEINSSVIALIASTRNSPQSHLTKVMEFVTGICVVVGFCLSFGGLYLITFKPKKLPFDFDPEVSKQNMGIAGGIATALGFIASAVISNLFISI